MMLRYAYTSCPNCKCVARKAEKKTTIPRKPATRTEAPPETGEPEEEESPLNFIEIIEIYGKYVFGAIVSIIVLGVIFSILFVPSMSTNSSGDKPSLKAISTAPTKETKTPETLTPADISSGAKASKND